MAVATSARTKKGQKEGTGNKRVPETIRGRGRGKERRKPRGMGEIQRFWWYRTMDEIMTQDLLERERVDGRDGGRGGQGSEAE